MVVVISKSHSPEEVCILLICYAIILWPGDQTSQSFKLSQAGAACVGNGVDDVGVTEGVTSLNVGSGGGV